MKTWTKIWTVILVLGWFPYMWVSAAANHAPDSTKGIVFLVGVVCCILGAFGVGSVVFTSRFWLREKVWQEKMKALDEQRENWTKAERALTIAAYDLWSARDKLEQK